MNAKFGRLFPTSNQFVKPRIIADDTDCVAESAMTDRPLHVKRTFDADYPFHVKPADSATATPGTFVSRGTGKPVGDAAI